MAPPLFPSIWNNIVSYLPQLVKKWLRHTESYPILFLEIAWNWLPEGYIEKRNIFTMFQLCWHQSCNISPLWQQFGAISLFTLETFSVFQCKIPDTFLGCEPLIISLLYKIFKLWLLQHSQNSSFHERAQTNQWCDLSWGPPCCKHSTHAFMWSLSIPGAAVRWTLHTERWCMWEQG